MNEFSAKKLGEVLAFARVGSDTIEKARKTFGEFLSDDDLEISKNKNQKHIEDITNYVKEKGAIDVVESEAQKMVDKLISMRDSYIGSEWETSSEVFEWWGFFGGGAIAHWNLVKGIAETFADDFLVELSYDAIAYHENLYDTSSALLADIGRSKSKTETV